MAGWLVATGVGSGQHVAVLMPNRPEYVFLIHALARLGAVLVPFNIRLTADELGWQVEQSDSQVLICCDETESLFAALNIEILNVDAVKDLDIPHIVQNHPLDLEAVQGIIYTSGTTGQPKGAMLTFGNHFYSATASAYRLGLDPVDRWLLCMPLYHVGGLAIVLRCCLYGITVVLQDKFVPEAVSHAVDTQGVSLISVVPTMLHRLLDSHQSSLTRAHLRCVLAGGAAMPSSLLERCRALRLPIATTYGLTEAASQVVTTSPGAALDKPGSVGKPLMFSSVEIVDKDGGLVDTGEIGEVVVIGPTVMKGYYKRAVETAQAMASGGLHTGDMGYLDEDGDLWVVQRRADLIVSGGENVYPAEVEQVLRAHPAVDDVCVVGTPNEEWGQQVAAAVVLCKGAAADEQSLLAFCREQLAGYKQPRVIKFVEALPLTASGKVRRDAVRRYLINDQT